LLAFSVLEAMEEAVELLQDEPRPRAYLADAHLVGFMGCKPEAVDAALRGLVGSGLVAASGAGLLELRGSAAAVAAAQQLHSLVAGSGGYLLRSYLQHLVADPVQLEAGLRLLQHSGLIRTEPDRAEWDAAVSGPPSSGGSSEQPEPLSHEQALACLQAAQLSIVMITQAAQHHTGAKQSGVVKSVSKQLAKQGLPTAAAELAMEGLLGSGLLAKDEDQGGTLQLQQDAAYVQAAVAAAGRLHQLVVDNRGCVAQQQLQALAAKHLQLPHVEASLHLLQCCGILSVRRGQAGVTDGEAWVAKWKCG
jgi:hypothetical protein